jgi:hypothetical protein
MNVHLMSAELLAECGCTEMDADGYLHVAPCTAPERITCPQCRPLVDQLLAQVIESDHAEALAENAAHDAAMTKAQELTPDTLARFSDVPAMPRSLANRLAARRHFSLIPPRRHA